VGPQVSDQSPSYLCASVSRPLHGRQPPTTDLHHSRFRIFTRTPAESLSDSFPLRTLTQPSFVRHPFSLTSCNLPVSSFQASIFPPSQSSLASWLIQGNHGIPTKISTPGIVCGGHTISHVGSWGYSCSRTLDPKISTPPKISMKGLNKAALSSEVIVDLSLSRTGPCIFKLQPQPMRFKPRDSLLTRLMVMS